MLAAGRVMFVPSRTLERARHDQPAAESARAPGRPARSPSSTPRRPCRRCRSTWRARLRLLRLVRPQGVRADRHRRPARPARAARGDAAVPRRGRHDLQRGLRHLDLERAALEVRGRHLADRRGRRTSARRSTTSAHSTWTGDRLTEAELTAYALDRLGEVPGPPRARTARRRAPRRGDLLRHRGHPPPRHRRDLRPRGGLHPRRSPLRPAAHAAPRRAGDRARLVRRLQHPRRGGPLPWTRSAARARCSSCSRAGGARTWPACRAPTVSHTSASRWRWPRPPLCCCGQATAGSPSTTTRSGGSRSRRPTTTSACC